MSKDREYAARLTLAYLNERYHREFRPVSFQPEGSQAPPTQPEGVQNNPDVWSASEPQAGALAIYATPLFETDAAWEELRTRLERRLDSARPGSYLLWLPPGGELPDGEPDESEWVRRVVLAASKLASGRSGEARFPRPLALGKVKDEGGYASVTGGLARHWPIISQKLEGSFYLDSRALNRLSRDEDERAELYENIGLLSQGVATGDVAEFEHEDAWSLQRLPRGLAGEGMTDGWAITGCPPAFDPIDGGAMRRLLRRRLAEAATALAGVRDAAKTLVLVGAYDYLESENAGTSLRGFDPGLTLPFDIIALVADAEVRPLLLSRALGFTSGLDG